MFIHSLKRRIDNAPTPEAKLQIIQIYVQRQRAKGEAIKLKNMDLRGVDFSEIPLQREKITVEKKSTNEDGATKVTYLNKEIQTFFNKSNLTGANFNGVDCTGICFKNAILEPKQFDAAIILDADFKGTIYDKNGSNRAHCIVS